MPWYYAINDQKFGPLPASALADLSRAGTLTADDLAWKEGLESWLPFRKVAGEVFGEADDSGHAEIAVCAFSNRALPQGELVPYGDQWIDPQHKDAFVQQLMETGEAGGEAMEERDLVPVGFWWRALSSTIDYLVLLIPSFLCMLPYTISSVGQELTKDPQNPFTGWTAVMVITYLLGLVGSFAINAGYHTWMVGKYQATVGKKTIGAIVTLPDGSRISYGRSFCRWMSKTFLNGVATTIGAGLGAFLGILLMGGIAFGSGNDPNPIAIIGSVLLLFGFIGAGVAIGLFPYWMAAFDSEKRALHDRVCSTRVIRKP